MDLADVHLWQRESMPVILVVYDGQTEKAYWLYVQHYLEGKNLSFQDLSDEQDRVTVRVPIKNRLNRKAIAQFRQFHDDLLKQMEGKFAHGN